MSFDYNYKFWVATQKDIDDIFKRQEVIKRLKPVENRDVSHYIFAEIYVRYVHLVNKLGYIYHHTFQVQKRDVVKGLIEAATQRLLELKNELKNLEFSEFIYVDKVLKEKRLTPDDIVVWTPKYFPYWRPTNVQEMISGPRKKLTSDLAESVAHKSEISQAERRKTAIDKEGTSTKHRESRSRSTIKEEFKIAPRTEEGTIKKQTSRASFKNFGNMGKLGEFFAREQTIDAVILIQSHERARVARVLLTNIRYNPKVYKPKMRVDGVFRYFFTHKPNQTMLIPVRRTRYDADFYSKKRDQAAFNYYVKPVYQQISSAHDDMYDSDQEDESSGSSIKDRFMSFAEETANDLEEAWSSEEDGESDLDSEKQIAINYKEFMERVRNLSATKIQKNWRAYRDRKKYKALVTKKRLIYGMVQEIKPKSVKVITYQERVEEAIKHRLIKERYDNEFVQFCTDERARILRVRGPWIMEDISDNIRDWFKEFYDKLSAFHPYPPEVKGGTLLLLKGETMNVFEYGDKLKAKKMTKEQIQKLKQKEKEKKKKLRDLIKKQKRAIAKRRATLKARGIIDMNDEMGQSKALAQIEDVMNKYRKEWADIDEKLNRKEEPIKSWITSDYYAEIHQELQLTVDELMRLEYELLQSALAKDLKKKYKPPRVKKPKNKKKKKKKPPFDMTADKSMETLYHELQDAGIIKAYPRKTFDSYIGERNHCAFDLFNKYMIDPPPYQGDLKDVLSEYVLGMGPLNITKPKSILLVGAPSSGKTHLCDILATEIDAVVFDLSPEKTAQFDSNVKYLVHLIVKMAKIVQPTILFIHDVHRIFWKKIPEEFEELSPRLLQSELKKNVLKSITKNDKIMLIGTTNAPWQANAGMKKLFQKILLVPKTEYATNFILRRNFILQHASVPRDVDITSLTLVTRNYNSGDIIRNINETVSLRRRMQLSAHPLHEIEFIEKFLDKDPPEFPMEQKMWEKFTKWYRKTNKNVKKRAVLLEMLKKMAAKAKKKK